MESKCDIWSKYDIDSHHNTTVNDFVHENGMIRREVSIITTTCTVVKHNKHLQDDICSAHI